MNTNGLCACIIVCILNIDKTNKASLDNIQHSMFAVCLDGPLTSSEGDPFDIAASIFIHGGGSRAYSGSRWYDKTLQVSL